MNTIIANIEGTIKAYEATGDVDQVRYWTNILAKKKADAERPEAPFVSRKQAKRNRKEAERLRRYED